jgi:hypothetical protein
MRVSLCESCGAPLPAAWEELVVVCPYCGSQNNPGAPGASVYPSLPADSRPRLNVGGRTWALTGLLARGDSCDVFQGRWVMRLGGLVVVKVLRALADGDLLRRERAVLERLHASEAQGAVHFARLLPWLEAFGAVRIAGYERLVAVHGWRPGFLYTLEDVRRAHPDGVDGRIAVWVWKRLLELLGWVHEAGFAHGAVLPPHVLVHPRAHGATLVGWSAAGALGEPLPAVSAAWPDLYPLRPGEPLTAAADLAMAARTVRDLAGGGLPGDLGTLLDEAAGGAWSHAWALRDRLDTEIRAAYGPPSYNPLSMPGWALPAAG